MEELAVASTSTDRALGERQAELRVGVLAAAEAVEPLPNGVRWRFAGVDPFPWTVLR